MSFFHLLASDRPLPLCDCRSLRTVVSGQVSFSGELGFSVENCTCYLDEQAHGGIKAYVYRMPYLVWDESTLRDLKRYLNRRLSSGDQAQLWHIWLGDDGSDGPPARYRGRLADLDMEEFQLLFGKEELCLTVTI